MSTDLNILEAPPPETKAAQLAKLLPGIEAALKRGYSHQVIFDHIKKTEGLDLTYQYYKITLHRLRKRVSASKANATPRLTSVGSSNLGTVLGPTTTPVAQASSNSAGGERFKYDVKASIDDFFS